MKGTIHKCLAALVKEEYGEDAWKKCLQSSGFEPERNFALTEDIEEENSINLIVESAKVLDIPLKKLFDQFGVYWCCTYAPKHYSFWYVGMKDAKAFIIKLDEIHGLVGKHFNNAKPPRFLYHWTDKNQKVLKVEYQSNRKLIDLYISLVNGLAIYFKEEIEINKISEHEVELTFDY